MSNDLRECALRKRGGSIESDLRHTNSIVYHGSHLHVFVYTYVKISQIPVLMDELGILTANQC